MDASEYNVREAFRKRAIDLPNVVETNHKHLYEIRISLDSSPRTQDMHLPQPRSRHS